MRVEPCCVPADDEALRPPSVATRALFEEASRILDARIVSLAEPTFTPTGRLLQGNVGICSGHLRESASHPR